MLNLVMDICKKHFSFGHYEEVGGFFKQLINVMKQMNYSEYESESFHKYRKELDVMIEKSSKEAVAS